MEPNHEFKESEIKVKTQRLDIRSISNNNSRLKIRPEKENDNTESLYSNISMSTTLECALNSEAHFLGLKRTIHKPTDIDDKHISLEFQIALDQFKERNDDNAQLIINSTNLVTYDGKRHKARSKVNILLLKQLVTDEETKGMSLNELGSLFGVSKNTIHRILKEDMKLKSSNVKVKRFIPNSADLRIKAQEYRAKLQEICHRDERIVYFDESTFEMKCSRMREWTESGRNVYIESKNYNDKVVLLLAITPENELIYQCYKNENTTETICSFLEEKKGQFEEIQKEEEKTKVNKIYFYLDNYQPHHSKFTKERLAEMGYELLYGPPFKPKANPVEFIFGFLKSKVHRNLYQTA